MKRARLTRSSPLMVRYPDAQCPPDRVASTRGSRTCRFRTAYSYHGADTGAGSGASREHRAGCRVQPEPRPGVARPVWRAPCGWTRAASRLDSRSFGRCASVQVLGDIGMGATAHRPNQVKMH
jgi:hypothetical protein